MPNNREANSSGVVRERHWFGSGKHDSGPRKAWIGGPLDEQLRVVRVGKNLGTQKNLGVVIERPGVEGDLVHSPSLGDGGDVFEERVIATSRTPSPADRLLELEIHVNLG